MTIGGNYAHPVYVNGYQCNNCTDVENAKKHIDPAHPKSGPFNINAATDPSVRFGGALGAHNAADVSRTVGPVMAGANGVGQVVDLSV